MKSSFAHQFSKISFIANNGNILISLSYPYFSIHSELSGKEKGKLYSEN